MYGLKYGYLNVLVKEVNCCLKHDSTSKNYNIGTKIEMSLE